MLFHFVLPKSGLIDDCSEKATSSHSMPCNFCTTSLGLSVALKCIKKFSLSIYDGLGYTKYCYFDVVAYNCEKTFLSFRDIYSLFQDATPI